MATVEAIIAAIAELPPEQVAEIRACLNEQAEAEWDKQIEEDERAGRLDTLADVARRIAAEQRARGYPGRSATELQAEDDANQAEDAERDQKLASARRNF